MKKIINLILGRASIIALFILLQVAWAIAVLWQFSYKFTYANLLFRGIAILVVLIIVNKWVNPVNKLSWTFLILLSPMVGLPVYFLFGRSGLTKGTQRKMDEYNRMVSAYLVRDDAVERKLSEEDASVYNQSRYISEYAGFPLYQNTGTKYFACGEVMFQDMLEDLRSAEHFIFLEYFIIEEGEMFRAIVDILEEKVKAGVEVRLIYDDVGCISTLPPKYYRVLQAKGIRCAAFNPFRPIISVVMNNRDHRKILVVDGRVGYTGGINLADEYINRIERFGYWKDTGIRIEGEGVWSLTNMFLSMWDYITHMTEDCRKFMPSVYQKEPFVNDGYVQPYGDSPLDQENVGENIYLNIIARAKRYVYIFTPYLIIDNEMLVTLCNAAKSGVDVRIVTPGIPDKKMVYLLTQSYYAPLLKGGVRIYQYTPGFLHAKSFVCDDEIATVGSVNLDFRSLYLHFECGVWLYRSAAVLQVKEDCLNTFACSKEISLEFCRGRALPIRMVQSVLRLFAPLL
ncbi:MAG: cardiolipin synthase [Roseburia sp.]|jgi:cardiolipin synthase|nr:cardiolipin synthase [Roseburia sp.]